MKWILATGASLIGTAHFALAEASPFLRMIVFCLILLLTVKAAIYRDWRRRHEALPSGRLLGFFAGIATNPSVWRRTKKPGSYRRDIAAGSACLIAGLACLAICLHYKVHHAIPLFISISLAFHFGLLRLLVAIYRARGIPERPAFANPLSASGAMDFWSQRWNRPYTAMMTRLIQRPLRGKAHPRWLFIIVFAASGLFHEIAITLPVMSHFGQPTAFFLFHGLLALSTAHLSPRLQRLIFWPLLLASLPVLFPTRFVDLVILAPIKALESRLPQLAGYITN